MNAACRTGDVNLFDLAPAAVARIASIPHAVLSDLIDPSLADQAEAAYRGRTSWPTYAAVYEAAVDAHRERLWNLTAGDRRFMLALTFANPTLAERVAGLPARAPRSKGRRHFETTLYRFLARAAGRSDPFGLWAGVSLVRFGEKTRTSPVPEVLKVEPELAPLFNLVRALARTPPYRSRGPWQLNPSLHAGSDGTWSFHAPVSGGAVARRLEPNPSFAALFHRLRGRASDIEALAAAVEPCCGDRETALATLDATIEGGILVGGLQPPWRFATAWEALEMVEEALCEPHRRLWNAARLDLRTACARLEDRGDALLPSEAAAGMQEASSVVARLAQSLDLPGPTAPPCALRCDMKAPTEIQLGADVRAAIERALDAYLRFQGEYGFGGAIRRAMLARYLPPGTPACRLGATPAQGIGTLRAPTWQGVCEAIGGDADFVERIARWEALLQRSADWVDVAGSGRLPGPPFGWFQLGFTAPPERGGEMIVHGVHDDLWGPYARHASFWSSLAPGHSLEAWIRGHVVEIARDAGIDLCEIAVPGRGSPNVLARPPLGLSPVSPWSCLPGAVNLQGASVVLAEGSVAPLLVVPGAPKPLAVLNAASADVQSTDAVVQQLLMTSLAAVPTPLARAANVLFACELDAERPSPAVTIGGTTTVRTRRTVLGAGAVSALLRGDVVRRFAAWSHLARRHGWPEHLIVRRADGMALVVHRDSPLAVGAVLEGAGSSLLTIEHGPAEAWLESGGQRYVAELSIPFLRRDHLWVNRHRETGTLDRAPEPR